MKCEQVQELFPELQEQPDNFPDAQRHLEQCASCRVLFHAFKGICHERSVSLDPIRSEASCNIIYRRIRRHDRFVLTRRLTAVAAVFMLVFISVFHFNMGSVPSLSDVSSEVLFLASDAAIIPEPSIEREVMIEYLAQYEYIELLGGLF